MKVFVNTNNKICAIGTSTDDSLTEIELMDGSFGEIPIDLIKHYYCYPSIHGIPTILLDKENMDKVIKISQGSIEEMKAYVLGVFGEACTQAIYEGTDVETSKGTKHFSYTDEDQRNLKAAADLAMSTGLDIPYHADKEDCCTWTADDIIKIYGANEYAKTYQTTYCNLLNGLVRSAESKADFINLQYGDELPEDKMTILSKNMKQAEIVYKQLLSKTM